MVIQSKELMRRYLRQARLDCPRDMSARNESVIHSMQSLLQDLFTKIEQRDFLAAPCPKYLNDHYNFGLYWPLLAEPDLTKLIITARWPAAIPKITGNSMQLVRYKIGDPLEESSLSKLYQPVRDTAVIPRILVVPGLGFSLQGYRIGFGKGYYDRYLATIKKIQAITTIGVCFHEKLFEYLPSDEHDVRLDYIVTDKVLIKI